MDTTRYAEHLQVFSQNDEDGAIEEVFRKIGTTDKVKHLYILEQNLLSIYSVKIPCWRFMLNSVFRMATNVTHATWGNTLIVNINVVFIKAKQRQTWLGCQKLFAYGWRLWEAGNKFEKGENYVFKKRELCFCLEALASLGLGMVSQLVSDFIF